MEIWKNIEGFEGSFAVSNLGRVKSLERFIERKNGSTMFVSEKIMATRINSDGYKQIYLRTKEKKVSISVHRLVALHFIVNEKNKKEVNHKNGIKTDNKAENLEWVSHAENMAHAMKAKLIPKPIGEKNPRATITEKTVKKIKTKLKNGMTIKEVCSEFKLKKHIVSDIKLKRTWAYVEI